MNKKQITRAVLPLIIFGFICFFVNDWRLGLATKEYLSMNYASAKTIKENYSTKAEQAVCKNQIVALNTGQNQIHRDIRLIMFGLAATHPEFAKFIAEKAQAVPDPKNPPKKYKLAGTPNGD